MEWGVGEGEVQEGGGICINIADSLHCTEETITTFKSNNPPPKKKQYAHENLFNNYYSLGKCKSK